MNQIYYDPIDFSFANKEGCICGIVVGNNLYIRLYKKDVPFDKSFIGQYNGLDKNSTVKVTKNNTLEVTFDNGLYIVYPDKTRRFINNSWYE